MLRGLSDELQGASKSHMLYVRACVPPAGPAGRRVRVMPTSADVGPVPSHAEQSEPRRLCWPL